MKKILLGTTTLIGAAGLFAGAALAESPKVTVGGFADFQLGVVSEDLDSGQRAHAFRSDTELTFGIRGVADNGLSYGGSVNLETDTTADSDSQGTNASETQLFVEGTFGRFEMGSAVGAANTMKMDASRIARATGGIDGDFSYFLDTPSTQYIITPDLVLDYGSGTLGDESDENLNKVTYYTPRFSGFQLGVSYIVNNDDRGQTIDRSDDDSGDADNIFVGGLNWEGKFDQVGIVLAATGEHGNAEATTEEDLRAWNVGGKLTYMGFSLAGSYGDWGDSLRTSSANTDDSDYWTVGGAYEMGAFGASVTYFASEYDIASTSIDAEFNNLSVGVDYKMAPGFTPYAEVNFFEFDEATATEDNDGTVFIAGTQLAF